MYQTSSRPKRSRSSSFSNHPSSGRSVARRPGRRFTGQHIDVSKFINKASFNQPLAAYVPKHTFADFPIHKTLLANILAKGYQIPTAIQDQTIPHGLQGKDIIGLANTGTGKTAAFLIPLIHKVATHHHARVLIMTPTRELALQIEQEFKEFSRNLNQYSTLCIGGANIGRQISQLRRGPQFVIGTPGRLKDLQERRCLDLSRFQSVVLDEADRMLDMGFIDDIKLLLANLPRERQTLFFSATLSPKIEYLTQTFLRQPVTVSVKTQDTAANVDQDIVSIAHQDYKLDQLHDLLIQPQFSKVLIFDETKRGVERLADALAERGFSATSIHGNKTQPKRQQALNQFKQDDVQILVATDVAARGLDIPNVSHVINYSLPNSYDDYIHRIGRTGRANNKGYALTFVTK